MAKQQKNTPPPQKQAVRKPASDKGFSPVVYILKNLLIFGIIFFALYLPYKNTVTSAQFSEGVRDFEEKQKKGYPASMLEDEREQLLKMQTRLQTDTGTITRALQGYRWALHDMAWGNYQSIQYNDSVFKATGADSSAQALYQTKMGIRVGNYGLFEYINKNTPKDAVIMLPPRDTLITKQGRWNFVTEPEWTEFFIYPRLCISPGDVNKYPALAKRVTHVLVVEGLGYENLKYEVPVEQRVREGIFPINQPPAGSLMP